MQITITVNPDTPMDVEGLRQIYEALINRNKAKPEVVPPWAEESPFPIGSEQATFCANPANPKEEPKPEPKPEAPKKDIKELKASIRDLGLKIVSKGQDAKTCFWALLTGAGTPTISPANHPKIVDIPEDRLEEVEEAMQEMWVKLNG